MIIGYLRQRVWESGKVRPEIVNNFTKAGFPWIENKIEAIYCSKCAQFNSIRAVSKPSSLRWHNLKAKTKNKLFERQSHTVSANSKDFRCIDENFVNSTKTQQFDLNFVICDRWKSFKTRWHCDWWICRKALWHQRWFELVFSTKMILDKIPSSSVSVLLLHNDSR